MQLALSGILFGIWFIALGLYIGTLLAAEFGGQPRLSASRSASARRSAAALRAPGT